MSTATKREVLADFTKNAAELEMNILMDSGIYRHLMFRIPGNQFNWFEIVTWPNVLTINGDYGTWSFSRVEDMFKFFRGRKLDPVYWEEKVLSCDMRTGPARKFDPETFRDSVFGSLVNYDRMDNESFRRRLVRQIDRNVFCEESEHDLRRALADFQFEGFEFSDPSEIDGRAYTYHYLYCLHSIVWAIQQYDAVKASRELPSAEAKS